jgi:hypothetical protein
MRAFLVAFPMHRPCLVPLTQQSWRPTLNQVSARLCSPITVPCWFPPPPPSSLIALGVVPLPSSSSHPPPRAVYPGLSPDDVLTVYFTRPTNHPDVTTTAKVQALLAFTPPLATTYRASWQIGGDAVMPGAADRLVIVLSGTVNTDIQSTLVAAVRVSMLRTGGLRDVGRTSQAASAVNVTLGGTWGDASQPQFLVTSPLVALDYGGQPGLGPGDALVLQFNQPVRTMPVGSTEDLDALLEFDPPHWASSYIGTWLDFTRLLVTVVAGPLGQDATPELTAASGVGSLRVTVRPSGGLTSFDGTSPPSTASAVVAQGSWGDPVCDSALVVFSSTTLVAAFTPPASGAYSPASYTLQVSSSPAFVDNATWTALVQPEASAPGVLLPPPLSPTSLRFLVPNLVEGVGYYGRVAPAPPALPPDLPLPRPVPLLFTALDSATGCKCGVVVSGGGCRAVAVSTAPPVSPQPPVISECSAALLLRMHDRINSRVALHVASVGQLKESLHLHRVCGWLCVWGGVGWRFV